MIRRTTIAALVAAAVECSAGAALAQTAAQCTAVLTPLLPNGAAPGADPCLTLAVQVATTSPQVNAAADRILMPDAVPMGAVFSQRDLQARNTQQAATGGTPAQGQAIPDVKPAGVAAGTIAAIGSNAGQDAIAALSINPAVLFFGEEVTKTLAEYSRFLDLTVFVPVSSATTGAGTGTTTGALKYYGARLRLNVLGISSGSAVWDDASQLLLNRISNAGRRAERVRTAFRTAPALKECVDALMADPPNQTTITATCGSPVDLSVDLAEAEQLRAALSKVRDAADAQYFGADIRVDVGDPTLGAMKDASGKFLFAGLAYGRRLAGSADGGASSGVRLRLGVRHGTLDSTGETEMAAEGGVGFELARRVETQEINAAVAFEFRRGNAAANLTDQFQTNFTMLRASIVIPITPGNSISINVGKPVSGDVSPILSVNFNWGLLLSNALRR